MADIKVRMGQHNATKVIASLAGAQTLSLSELSDVNFSAKISLGGLDLGQLFTFKGSMIQPSDFQTKSKWCVR